MTPHAFIFTLAAIGVAETVYLVRSRRQRRAPVCPLGENCMTVLTSRYARFLLVPNDILGLGFYITVMILTAFLVLGVAPVEVWEYAVVLLVLLSAVVSLALTVIQWRVVHAWCLLCVLSAVTTWLMALVVLTRSLTLPV